MAKLIITLPGAGEVVHELTDNIVTVGRTSDNKIQINDRSVSAHHAKLILANGQYRVRDLDSTNKTFVKGVAISETVLIGQLPLRFGNIECLFEDKPADVRVDEFQKKLSELQKQVTTLQKEKAKVDEEKADLTGRFEAEQKKVVAFTMQGNTLRQTEVQLTEIVNDTKKRLEAASAERDKLKAEKEKLASELKDIKHSTTRIGSEADSARLKLEAELRTKDEQSARALAEVAELKTNLSLVTRERDTLRTERENITGLLADAQQATRKLSAERDDARRHTEALQQQASGSTKLADELAAARNDADAADKNTAAAQQKINGLSVELEGLKKELQSTKEALAKSAKDLDAATQSADAARSASDASNQSIQGLNHELELLQKEIIALKESNAALTKARDEGSKSSDALQQKISALEATQSGAREEKNALSAIRDELAKTGEVLAKERDELRGVVDAVQKERDEFARQVAELTKTAQSGDAAAKEVATTRDALGAKVKESEAALGELGKTLAERDERLAAVEAEKTKTFAAMVELDKKAHEFETENDNLKDRLAEVERTAAETMLQRDKVSGEIVSVRAKLESMGQADSRVMQLDADIDKASKENKSLVAKLEEQMSNAAAMAQERDQHRDEVVSLRKRVLDLENQSAQASDRKAAALRETSNGNGRVPVGGAVPSTTTLPPSRAPKAALRPAPTAAPIATAVAGAAVVTAAHTVELKLAEMPGTRPPVPADFQPAATVQPLQQATAPATGLSSDALVTAGTEIIGTMRGHLHNLIRRPGDTPLLQQLLAQSKTLSERFGQASDFRSFQKLASVVELLVADLVHSPDRVPSSTLRSISHAIDVLGMFMDPKHRAKGANLAPATAFAVDADLEAQKEIAAAMDTITLSLSVTDKAQTALSLIEAKKHDLIMISVELEDMSGIEVCSRVRLIPHCRKTPILLLTAAPSVGSWAQWSLNGASDFITKPFNHREFAVKVLAWTLRGQIMG